MLANAVLQPCSPPRPRRAVHAQQCSISGVYEIKDVVEEVLSALPRERFTREDRFAVRMALEEALVNAIKHGHKYDPSKRVRIRYRVNAKRLLMEITDQGPGYDPRQVPDPLALENLEKSGGRGLLLIRAYMTWIRLNQRGNRVVLRKNPSHR